MADGKLRFFQQAVRVKGGAIAMHSHACYELVYYASGSGATEIDGQRFIIDSNSCALIYPKVPHEEQHSLNTQVSYFGFDGFPTDMIPAQGLYCAPDPCVRLLFDQIFAEAQNQSPYYEAVLQSQIAWLLLLLRRQSAQPAQHVKTLSYAREYIQEHYQQKLDLRALAASTGYGYDYFQHKFKQETGFSPQQYVMQLRLKNAKRLLKTDMSCTEIALSCGFYGSAQFSTLFKAHYGETPLSYRQREADAHL